MALAVWEIAELGEPFEESEPEPFRLGLVPDLVGTRSTVGRCRDHVGSPRSVEEEWAWPAAVQVGRRQECRPVPGPRSVVSLRARRLRVVAALFVLGLAVLLALPVRAWAGQASGPEAAGRGGSTVGHPSVYVVQAGDTLWSIATRLVPGADPRAMVSQLAQETGSTTVVPGEHIVLPG